MGFWAALQPHSISWPWERPGICILNTYMNDLDVPVGLGIARAELPEGCGRNGGRNGGSWKGWKLCIHLRHRPWDFQNLGSWCTMGSSKLGIQLLKQSRRPRVFLIREVVRYGAALPSMRPSCFLLSDVRVFSLLPTVAIFKQVMFCFVF